MAAREGLSWAELCRDAPDWLSSYLEVPGDAAPPLWVSAVHDEAVGSYGAEAIAWMESNLTERGRPLRLRWWQRLAMVLQLQHRADGSLCWRVVLESGPRRIGKSVRLRAMALWRLANGPTMFEPEQLIVHTGKDLAIVREVLRKAWPWAEATDGWGGKRGMTEPEVSYLGVNRWVARSKDATTGYDCCLALVDESWDVPPASIDDDLEPSMLERVSPQLLLTSTAHRRATSLMRGRILDALTVDDGETLLLIWAAPPGADWSEETTWRAASPHWSEDRRQMIASKYAKALAGQDDPEFDDPDPVSGWASQYMNAWRLREAPAVRGSSVVSPQAWAELVEPVPFVKPDAVAVEGWPGEGISVALAWRQDERCVVSVVGVADLAAAVQVVHSADFRGTVIVGKSLIDDPALRRTRRKPGEGRTSAAVQAWARLLTEGSVRHDDGAHLTHQVLALRTLPGTDGPRMVSTDRADAVKAAAWAVERAVFARSRNTRIVLPSGATA